MGFGRTWLVVILAAVLGAFVKRPVNTCLKEYPVPTAIADHSLSHERAEMVAIVTGSTGGLGYATAERLLKLGVGKVYITGRTKESADAAVGRLKSSGAIAAELDLSDLASVVKFATMFSLSHSRLDVLINNAAVVRSPYTETENGFESQIGVNHLAHYLLTRLLIPKIINTTTAHGASGARIVHVSSWVADKGKIMPERWKYSLFDDGPQPSPADHYGNSKLAQVFFSNELANRFRTLGLDGITSNAVHPGMVITGAGKHVVPEPLHFLIPMFASLLSGNIMHSMEEGIATQIRLALSPGMAGVSGAFLDTCKPRYLVSKEYYDLSNQNLVWEASRFYVDPQGYLFGSDVTDVKPVEEWWRWTPGGRVESFEEFEFHAKFQLWKSQQPQAERVQPRVSTEQSVLVNQDQEVRSSSEKAICTEKDCKVFVSKALSSLNSQQMEGQKVCSREDCQSFLIEVKKDDGNKACRCPTLVLNDENDEEEGDEYSNHERGRRGCPNVDCELQVEEATAKLVEDLSNLETQVTKISQTCELEKQVLRNLGSPSCELKLTEASRSCVAQIAAAVQAAAQQQKRDVECPSLPPTTVNEDAVLFAVEEAEMKCKKEKDEMEQELTERIAIFNADCEKTTREIEARLQGELQAIRKSSRDQHWRDLRTVARCEQELSRERERSQEVSKTLEQRVNELKTFKKEAEVRLKQAKESKSEEIKRALGELREAKSSLDKCRDESTRFPKEIERVKREAFEAARAKLESEAQQKQQLNEEELEREVRDENDKTKSEALTIEEEGSPQSIDRAEGTQIELRDEQQQMTGQVEAELATEVRGGEEDEWSDGDSNELEEEYDDSAQAEDLEEFDEGEEQEELAGIESITTEEGGEFGEDTDDAESDDDDDEVDVNLTNVEL